jgi:hypothetical protein
MMDVGDIAYIRVSARGGNQQLMPIKVAEKIIRHTLEGSVTSYIIRSPTGEDYELDPEREEFFTSIDDAKKTITNEAMVTVDKVIEQAKRLEQKYFGRDIMKQDTPLTARDHDHIDTIAS